jgi:Iron-containing redox enzyme
MSALTRPAAGKVLRIKLEQADPVLRAAAAALWWADGLGERYPRYLWAMHGVIRASVPLMQAAAARCAELSDADPVAAPLREYLRLHIAEERDHDEWLLQDLAALGVDPAAVRTEQPPLTVARLVGPQYYWIEHHHPVALLGYMAVLESNSPHARLADHIMAEGRVPEAAVRTVRAHAALDPGHSDAIFELLDALPLTGAQASAVTISALSTVEALIALFVHIGRRTREPGRRTRDD